MSKNNYTTLASISVKDKVERKGNFDYLSWANAWHMLKTIHPNAQRVVYESVQTELNYFTDGSTAYVKVGIIIDDVEHIDYLPVMDYRNNSIPLEKVTSMDVNTAIQRSTAKAIAMHGLGLSLWTGEDVPQMVTKKPTPKTKATTKISLDIGDENWAKVMKYIGANKHLGLTQIVKNLETKYKMKATVKKEIEKAM
jgi:ribosomal protein L31